MTSDPKASLTPEEIKKLRSYVSYGNVWPAFFAIGISFLVIGIQGNNVLLSVGIVFTIMSATWFGSGVSAKKKLEAHGIPVNEEKKNES